MRPTRPDAADSTELLKVLAVALWPQIALRGICLPKSSFLLRPNESSTTALTPCLSNRLIMRHSRRFPPDYRAARLVLYLANRDLDRF